MYDRKCDVDIRLLGCALVLLVMALLTIHTGLAKKAVTAAADPAPAAVVSTQDPRLSEDAGSSPAWPTIQFVLEPDSLRKRVRVRFLFTRGSEKALLGTVSRNEQRQGITMAVVSCLLKYINFLVVDHEKTIVLYDDLYDFMITESRKNM